MRRVTLPILALALTFALPQAGQAQVDFGIGAIYNTEIDDGGSVGVDFRVLIGLEALPFGLQGTFDYLFNDVSDYWDIGVNGVFGFAEGMVPFSPYIGGGATYLNLTEDFGPGVEDSDFGFQLLAGAEFGQTLRPYVELKYQFRGDPFDDAFIIGAGITF